MILFFINFNGLFNNISLKFSYGREGWWKLNYIVRRLKIFLISWWWKKWRLCLSCLTWYNVLNQWCKMLMKSLEKEESYHISEITEESKRNCWKFEISTSLFVFFNAYFLFSTGFFNILWHGNSQHSDVWKGVQGCGKATCSTWGLLINYSHPEYLTIYLGEGESKELGKGKKGLKCSLQSAEIFFFFKTV